MSSIFDMDDRPLTQAEKAEALKYGKERLRLWVRRSIYAGGALFLSCASVVPFLYGHFLHVYWNAIGRYLVLLSMGLLLPFVACIGIAFNSWIYLRDVKKDGM